MSVFLIAAVEMLKYFTEIHSWLLQFPAEMYINSL